MHQAADEQPLLDLKPEFGARNGTSIEDVLERARLRAAQRDEDQSRERLLPNLAPHERPWQRVMWFVIAIVVVWMHFYVVRSFWAPAHPGVDQNGYQVGGKMFSQTLSTGFKPPNPFSYVGWMWVMTPDGWMYPKYPLGVPVLDAICIWIAPTFHQGVIWSYFVSPVCTVLASAAMFLMLRMVASSFAAVIGTILIASNPVALVLANNSNSHAAALAFASWGILFLMWWMRYGGGWRGLIAGFLLGYAMTIRYTEGLLVLPIAAAILTGMRYQRRQDVQWKAAAIWMIPALTFAFFSIGDAVLIANLLPDKSSTRITTAQWPAAACLVTLGLLVSALTILRYSPERRRWFVIVGEVARGLVVAGIVFGLCRIELVENGWHSNIDRAVTSILFKLALLGMVPLMYAVRWREPRTYLRPAVVALGWLIPVVALVAFNKCAMGSWTGYDTTNESEGFSWTWFMDKWDFMIGQVYNTGLFFVISLGVAGMIFLYRKSARVALVMTLWFVPGVLLYTSYYWGLNRNNGVGYLRFFLTLFPPMVFCAVWLLDDISRRGIRRGSVAAPIACGLVVAIAAGMNVYSARGAMERDFTVNANLASDAEHVLTKTKDTDEKDPTKRPLLFGELRGFLNYIQYAGNYECYSSDAFTQLGGRRMWQNQDPDMPRPLQQARVDAMRKLYGGKSDADLWKEGTKIIDQALSQKRHVYVALPSGMMIGFKSRFLSRDYELSTLERWRDPVAMSEEAKKAMNALGPGLANRVLQQNWELIEVTKKAAPAPVRPNPAPVRNNRPVRENVAPGRATPATTQSTTRPAR